MVGKKYFFVLCYANLYRFNLAFNFNPQFCISHVFGSLCGWYLDDICEKAADQSFRQTVQSAQFSTWSMRKKFLVKKLLCCVCCGQVLKEIKWNS